MKRASEKRIAVGQGSTLGMTQQTAGSVVTSAVLAKFAIGGNAKLAVDTHIATGKGSTHQMILPTAGNAAKSAVQARFASVEDAKRA